MAQALAGNAKKQSAKVSTFTGSTPAKNHAEDRLPPRSLAIAEKGIRTVTDFCNLFSALMSDVLDGRVASGVSNATCNAGGKLLKAVEMQERYGKPAGVGQNKNLVLSPGNPLDLSK